jgi:hypothetical protein
MALKRRKLIIGAILAVCIGAVGAVWAIREGIREGIQSEIRKTLWWVPNQE